MGATYKENVADFRNSKILDLIKIFKKRNIKIFTHDPFSKNINFSEKKIYNFKTFKNLPNDADVLIYAVPHLFYEKKSFESFIKKLKLNGLFFDLRGKISEEIVKKYNRQYITL